MLSSFLLRLDQVLFLFILLHMIIWHSLSILKCFTS